MRTGQQMLPIFVSLIVKLALFHNEANYMRASWQCTGWGREFR